MKKAAIVALITASALLMAGAGGSAAADGKAGRVHTVSNATHAIHKPIPGGRTPGSPALRGVKYETLDISQAPAEIQEWASRLVEAGGKGAKQRPPAKRRISCTRSASGRPEGMAWTSAALWSAATNWS